MEHTLYPRLKSSLPRNAYEIERDALEFWRVLQKRLIFTHHNRDSRQSGGRWLTAGEGK